MAGLLPIWHGAAAETYTKGNLSVVVFDDPATGAKHVAVEVPRSQPAGSFLSFICRDGRPFLGVGLIGRRFDRPENFSAVLQIDDLPRTKALLLAARDAPFLIANISRSTYAALSKARKISVSLAAPGRARLSYAYRLTETEEAFQPLLAACPLSSALDAAPPAPETP